MQRLTVRDVVATRRETSWTARGGARRAVSLALGLLATTAGATVRAESAPAAVSPGAPAAPAADSTAAGSAASSPAAPVSNGASPPPASSSVAPKLQGLSPADAAPAAASASTVPAAVYGVALRGRWISVPSWTLDLFTKANVPLSSYHVGAEFFRRKGDYDLVLGLSYQNMSPPDGNWLGRGKDASIDTDFVQFRDLAIISFDVGFVWHQAFTEWAGMHYGGGVGLGVVTGKILRTSSAGCTDDNIGNLAQCHPNVDPFTEAGLQRTEGGGADTPSSPHRFKEGSVPSVVPVLNIILGVDFKIPTIPGVEVRIDGGFFDAFFLGGAVGYVFL